MSKKYIDVMDTTFRDGIDSIFCSPVSMEYYLPAVSVASECGVTHFEFVERRRFSSIDLLKIENPFEMMVRFREAAGEEANLQVNAYSVNTVMKSCASGEFIDLFAELFSKYETTTIRNYDPLNDVKNLEYSGNAIANSGIMHEVSIVLNQRVLDSFEIYDLEFYENKIIEILDSGVAFDSFCFIDELGNIAPKRVYDIIKLAREILGDYVHLRFHTHDTLGMGIAQYLAALEADVDGIDLANSPVSGGVSQPDMLSMLKATMGSEYNLGDLELEKILKYQNYLKDKLSKQSLINYAKEIHPEVIFTPLPANELLLNAENMRRDGNFHLFNKVTSKINDVIEKGGFASIATPISSFFWKQAYANTVFGDWKKITKEYGKMVLGYYGKTPIVADPKVVEIAQRQLGLESAINSAIEIANKNPYKKYDYWREKLEDMDIDPTQENIFLAMSTSKEYF